MNAAATQYGATYSTEPDNFGQITSVFTVSEDWDGYRFHGYCLPTQEDVAEFFGDQVAA